MPDPALYGLFVVAALALLAVPGPAVLYIVAQSMPQFVDVDAGAVGLQILVLGLTLVALGLVSDGAYALLAGTLAGRLRRARRAASVGRWTSGGLVGLGVTAALAGPKRNV